MSARADQLAAKVEQVNNDLLAAVESSTPQQWTAPCSDGDWTQGFAAYHAAVAISTISDAVKNVADGNQFPKMSMAEIDTGNAELLREHADCTIQETVELIKANGPAAVNLVRSLSDEQLDIKVQLMDAMPEVNVHMMIELALVGHAMSHVAAINGAR